MIVTGDEPDYLTPPAMNARGWFTIRAWTDPQGDSWIIDLVPMLFNWRVVMMRADEECIGYWYAWCYARVSTAVLAVIGWEPEIEDEPAGWHKRACSERRAPKRYLRAPIRVRCIHGAYGPADCGYVGCEGGWVE